MLEACPKPATNEAANETTTNEVVATENVTTENVTTENTAMPTNEANAATATNAATNDVTKQGSTDH